MNKFDGRYEEMLEESKEKAINELKEKLFIIERYTKDTEHHNKGDIKSKKLDRVVMSQILRKVYQIVTPRDNEEMLYYNDGIYQQGAEIKLKEEAQKLFPKISKHEKEEVLELIRGKTYIDRDDLNANKWEIALKNKIYNIKEDNFRNHNPKDLFSVSIPVKYDKKADCPKIKKFLSEILDPSNIPVIQELFGYCLYREYPIQKAIMFIGEGANGKSVLLNLLKTFLGKENVSSIPLQSLDRNRFAASQLYNKLANIYPDISNRALYDTGVFKMMVGGDMITAEQKFRDGFNFTNYAKLLFSCNQLPETHDNTKAYFRRWIIIDFPNTFKGSKADKKLIHKLTTEEELSGLLNWAIEGLKRLTTEWDFTNSKAMNEIERIYKMKSSPLSAFVDSELEINMGEYVTKDELYEKFQDFCENNGLDILQKQEVGKKLPQLITKVRTERIRIDKKLTYIWRNLKIIGSSLEQQKNKESLEEGEKRESKCSNCSMINTTFNHWEASKKKIEYIKDKNIVEQLEHQKYTKEDLIKTLQDSQIEGERAEKTIELWLKQGIIVEQRPNEYVFMKE